MTEWTSRFAMLVGEDAVASLAQKRVAVFGVGGVGGHATEALARSGVGHITLIDNDVVSVSNLNRQLIATHATIGKSKVEMAKARILDINPACEVICYPIFYSDETASQIDITSFDYIVDAIDSVKSKLLLIRLSKEANVPIISCMGTGNKFDPSKLVVTDIAKTSVCPLARVMRAELRKMGIIHSKVVYSTEPPMVPTPLDADARRAVPGSTAFVPASAGLLIASEVVKDLLSITPANGNTPAHR